MLDLQLPPGGEFVEADEYRMECPECGGHNFDFNPRKKAGYCFNCHFRVGSLAGLWRALGRSIPTPRAETAMPAPKNVWTTTRYPLDRQESTPAVVYLASRGVGLHLGREVGVRYSPETNRAYFPLWSPFPKKPLGWKSRNLSGPSCWLGQPGIHERLYLFGRKVPGPTVVLVEGVFDVLSPGLWTTAYALLGSSLSREMEEWLACCYRKVVLWFDPDSTGVTKSREVFQRFRTRGVEVKNLSGHHPEPGSTPVEEARRIVVGVL